MKNITGFVTEVVEKIKRTRFLNKDAYTEREQQDMRVLHSLYNSKLQTHYKIPISETILAMNGNKPVHHAAPIHRIMDANSMFTPYVTGAFLVMQQYDNDRESRMLSGYVCDPKELTLDLIREILHKIEGLGHADAGALQKAETLATALGQFITGIMISATVFADEPKDETGIIAVLSRVSEQCKYIEVEARHKAATISAKDILQSINTVGKRVVDHAVRFLFYVANADKDVITSFSLTNALQIQDSRIKATKAKQALDVLIHSQDVAMLIPPVQNQQRITGSANSNSSMIAASSSSTLAIPSVHDINSHLPGTSISTYFSAYNEESPKKLSSGIIEPLANDKEFIQLLLQAHVVVQDFSGLLVITEKASSFAAAGGDIAIYIIGRNATEEMLQNLSAVQSHLFEALETLSSIVHRKQKEYLEQCHKLPDWYKNVLIADDALQQMQHGMKDIAENIQRMLLKLQGINIKAEKERWQAQAMQLSSMCMEARERTQALLGRSITTASIVEVPEERVSLRASTPQLTNSNVMPPNLTITAIDTTVTNTTVLSNCTSIIGNQYPSSSSSTASGTLQGPRHESRHHQVMRILAEKLCVPISETITGDVVERRLVAKAGIYTSQKKAMYRENQDGSTRFHLYFAVEMEYKQFISYYNDNYPGFIVRVEGYTADLSIIHVDTNILLNTIAPTLQESLDKQEPVLSHEALMSHLVEGLCCNKEEAPRETAQVLVAMAGVYTKQDGATCQRQPTTTHTSFILNISTPQDYSQIIGHYTCTYVGCLVGGNSYDIINKKATITMSSKVLHEQVLPIMSLYKLHGHEQMMQTLSSTLQVPYQEVYIGYAVENSLVNMAGIHTSQSDAHAMYRRNTHDYSTRFHLAFANSGEYQQFVNYYKQQYPQLILREEGYQQPLSIIHVSSKALPEVLAAIVQARGQGNHRG